jgi:magnesium transporter
MAMQDIFEKIQDHVDMVIRQEEPLGQALWQELLTMHAADIAQLFANLEKEKAKQLFLKLPLPRKLAAFSEFSYKMKVFCLSFINDHDRATLLTHLPIDELTDFLDELSDDELRKYLNLLHKEEREQVLSLLQFNPESAGGIMDTNVFTLMQDFTVEKSIQILQRLQPNRDLYQKIFVINKDKKLVGNIHLEDLVLKHPKTHLESILRPNELIVYVDEDREQVAKNMIHYNLMIAPVVGKKDLFLGVISSDTLVEVIEQEASEDIYRMASLTPLKHTYFETSFYKLFYQRVSVLIMLLLIQTVSSFIIQRYEMLLAGFLMYFLTMLINAGGNASSQTSALAIQGMATGEINDSNSARFIRRELTMALLLALSMSLFSFARTYITHGALFWESAAVSISLAVIVFVSIGLGSCMPFLLKKLRLDPAHSAGPLLTTLMDVIGLIIYCSISQLILV